MHAIADGPASPLFEPAPFKGNADLARPPRAGLSADVAGTLRAMKRGDIVGWGIPFRVGRVALLRDAAVTVRLAPVRTTWLVFLHAAAPTVLTPNADGFYSTVRGAEPLGEKVADYTIVYDDGREWRLPIRRRYEIASWNWSGWPANGLTTVPFQKPRGTGLDAANKVDIGAWGIAQTRAAVYIPPPIYWLWAWSNPRPETAIQAVRLEPSGQTVVVAGISAGQVGEHPLRWRTRRKAILKIPRGAAKKPLLDMEGFCPHVRLDLGQVISVTARPLYPDAAWAGTHNNQLPRISDREIIVEYTSHAEARFHLAAGRSTPVAAVERRMPGNGARLQAVPPSDRLVGIRVLDKHSRKPLAVKLHIHGTAGEYLPPVDRHRQPNPHWFEDYSPDFTHQGVHHCAYIAGETKALLPLGRVFVEVSKGFEMRPLRRVVRVTRATDTIMIEVDQVLPWRRKGWVTADTHVHFLSPQTALLEGAGEGVNVVNLLASQWGELMTNVGDFDGRTTHGAREAGGTGEYLVRVGSENRQPVLGHISLLGYNGALIAPMTTGGPTESALGDPVGGLLLEWARQCRKQGGLVVLPHHPRPRAEGAAALVSGVVDGVEMTSWGDLYHGIDPYSLCDWYRFLNCGYRAAAVAGTDKMSAMTAVGTIRTYARLRADEPFTYANWMRAIRRAHTFVTYGPLMEVAVEGQPPGARLRLSRTGGTLAVEWEAASLTLPMTRVDLVINGEIRESRSVGAERAAGRFTARVERSSWLALLIRGRYADQPREMIAAHSSPVMVEVDGTPFGSAADTVTILEQIEGALAYLDTIGTRAATAVYRRLRLQLTAAHRTLHNRMHRLGHDHAHTPPANHAAHRR